MSVTQPQGTPAAGNPDEQNQATETLETQDEQRRVFEDFGGPDPGSDQDASAIGEAQDATTTEEEERAIENIVAQAGGDPRLIAKRLRDQQSYYDRRQNQNQQPALPDQETPQQTVASFPETEAPFDIGNVLRVPEMPSIDDLFEGEFDAFDKEGQKTRMQEVFKRAVNYVDSKHDIELARDELQKLMKDPELGPVAQKEFKSFLQHMHNGRVGITDSFRAYLFLNGKIPQKRVTPPSGGTVANFGNEDHQGVGRRMRTSSNDTGMSKDRKDLHDTFGDMATLGPGVI